MIPNSGKPAQMPRSAQQKANTTQSARAPVLGLAASLLAACSLPPHAVNLRQVVEDELGGDEEFLQQSYRCTVGAHRGDSVHFTENTMAALQAAEADDRYAFIEFDVQYSKDKKIVVFHDRRLLRVFGSLRAINETPLGELLTLTRGEIATYSDVMDVLNKKLNIEIKSQGDPEDDRKLADELIADLRARNRVNDVLISSISSDVIQYVKETYPEFKTGKVIWLTTSTYLHFDSLTESLYESFNATEADYLLLHVANLHNLDNLLRLKPKNKTILFWDFDDTIYLVHKDNGDRLWGDSALREFLKDSHFALVSPFSNSKSAPHPRKMQRTRQKP